jgi:hypothetical protein
LEGQNSGNSTKISNATATTFCDNQDPQSRLINNGTIAYTFTIIDIDQNVIEILNVAPGASSSWSSFNEGLTIFSVDGSAYNVSDSKVVLDMSTCTKVEIVINNLNEVNEPIILTLD